MIDLVTGEEANDYQVKGFVEARDMQGAKTRSESSVRVPPREFSNEEITTITDNIVEQLSQSEIFESVGRYIIVSLSKESLTKKNMTTCFKEF